MRHPTANSLLPLTAPHAHPLQALPAELRLCEDLGTFGSPDGACYSSISHGSPAVIFVLQQAAKGVTLTAAQAFQPISCEILGAMPRLVLQYQSLRGVA